MPATGSVPGPTQSYSPVVAKETLVLRILLVVVLAAVVLITGLFSFFGLLGISNGATSPGDLLFAGVVLFLCAVSLLAIAGIVIRASWARPVVLVAGTAISLTCIGMVPGIPILIAASRANLSRQRTNSRE